MTTPIINAVVMPEALGPKKPLLRRRRSWWNPATGYYHIHSWRNGKFISVWGTDNCSVWYAHRQLWELGKK